MNQDRPFRAADGATNCVAERCAAFSRQVVPPDRLIIRQIDLRRERERRRQIAVLSAPQAPMESPKNNTRLP